MPDERRQFRILYRAFLGQLIDPELLATAGDPFRLLAQAGALLLSVSLIFAMSILAQYRYATARQIAEGSWGDQEFLIGATMALAGMFTVVVWDSIFPARRDCLVLGALPVRSWTLLRAKSAASLTGLLAAILALNAFTGVVYPLRVGGVGAYWTAIVAAGVTVFCGLLGLQALLALALPYRWFLRASNGLQAAAFFGILGTFLLTPGPSELNFESGLPDLVRRLPSFWFLGMFQQMQGAALPRFVPLAGKAWVALAASVTLAAAGYALAYSRVMRKLVEEPDLAPANRRPASTFGVFLARRVDARPVSRAIILFAARTAVRSRQHRNLLAAFGGLGLALALTFAKGMLYGNSRMYELARAYEFRPPQWYEPNTAMVSAGFILLFLSLLGMRTAFATPAALRANWVFRITTVHSPAVYFAAIRKAALLLGALPVCLLAGSFYGLVWGGLAGWGYALVLAAVALILCNRMWTGFRKLPFACGYLPGESNLRMKLPLYGSAFLFAVAIGGEFVRAMFDRPTRTVALFGALGVLAFQSARRWRTFAHGPFEELQFDPQVTSNIQPLSLNEDAAYSGNLRYLDRADADPPRFRQRAMAWAGKSLAAAVMLATVGLIYEQAARAMNPRPPRIGQAIDIGGRKLNLSCAGEGAPAVVFESGRGGLGSGWARFQGEASRYTRACWYDRAGYGWSDPAPSLHPASAIAADLHILLARAGIRTPVVLVGFSFGGLAARVYAGRYPKDVAGMVLIDATHFDERERILPPGGGWLPYLPGLLPALGRWSERVGLVRLAMPRTQINPFEPRTLVESLKELDYPSALEARQVQTLGNLPLVVLTAGRHRGSPPENVVEARQQQRFEARWIEAQQQLARLSSRGEQRVFPEAGHNLLRDRPLDVADAIREMVQAAR